MRMSTLKCILFSVVLATGAGAFAVQAHEGEGESMMSGGMMGGMMKMMSEMSPEERKEMTDACMKMMQSATQKHQDSQ
ncbi:hypothetical protein [Marinobacter fonticola]|uniref:hypothetical protein n=1 Tax=Marinobacter fonticola TaxID=2603215 RepID=UPI0011E736DF|nr:hypothetical protein [Marinobacter fonticola]